MHLKHRNVNQAFVGLVAGIANGQISTIKAETRNGPVLQVEDPITVTYEKPLERVLFNQARDCNPMFHLYEALWMLAGRNDVAPLNYYLSGKYNLYSDDTVTANGAYGYRWRHALPSRKGDSDAPYWDCSVEPPVKVSDVDQLQVIIDHLKERPTDRRCVLQMWNVEDDLLKMKTSRDVCCNLSVMFGLRRVVVDPRHPIRNDDYTALDITVTNRSNDLIYGMLGANVVHFSFLQEYMAAQLGVEVGKYHQFSNNLHVYTETNSGFKPNEWLAEEFVDYRKEWKHVPLVKDPKAFDEELPRFVEANYETQDHPWNNGNSTVWQEPFLNTVAQPMFHAFSMHKYRDYEAAAYWCDLIAADDWRLASTNWINKRRKNWEAKQGVK